MAKWIFWALYFMSLAQPGRHKKNYRVPLQEVIVADLGEVDLDRVLKQFQ